jgi:dCMP deaminase
MKMNWDSYFLEICNSVAKKSPCLSRNIGTVLVRDKSIISTGFNGPARGIPHCGEARCKSDKELNSHLAVGCGFVDPQWFTTCPRKLMGYSSGTHMDLCSAQHAEENAVSNAARNGVSVLGSVCYLNAPIPCKNCFSTLINAGIVEIVCSDLNPYDKHTQFIIDNSSIKLRKFEVSYG